jgi:hypothetical protein
MEFSMRNHIRYTAAVAALLGGTSLAPAQTVETVIAQQPAIVTVPVQTTETVQTTTGPAPRIVSRRVLRSRTGNRVTTTQTTVRESVVPAPAVAAVAAYPRLYDVVVPPPPAVMAAPAVVPPSAPIYDVVAPGTVPPAAVVAQPVAGSAVLPSYRYVYQPDRILVIDANTGIAVQAIPR